MACSRRSTTTSDKTIERGFDQTTVEEIAAAAGVPVLSAPDKPTEADLPLLVKASAGLKEPLRILGGFAATISRDIEKFRGQAATEPKVKAFIDYALAAAQDVELARQLACANELNLAAVKTGLLGQGKVQGQPRFNAALHAFEQS